MFIQQYIVSGGKTNDSGKAGRSLSASSQETDVVPAPPVQVLGPALRLEEQNTSPEGDSGEGLGVWLPLSQKAG